MRCWIVGSLALILVGLPTVTSAEEEPKKKAAAAPEFALKDTTGKEHKLSDYKDRIVVLEWTEPGCPYVKRHYRERTMQELAERYGKRGVVWLGMCSTRETSSESLEKFREQYEVKYAILFDDTGRVGRAYGAKTTPHMFIIKDGKTVYEGAIDDDPRAAKEKRTQHVADALDELLAGKSVSTSKTRPYG